MIDLTRAVWRKSSRSNGNGGDCVEVATNLAWRKSSRSSGQGGDCVEVAADERCGVVAIRDSKDPHGPVLAVPPEAWRAFLAALPD
jgi:hypothetical protein